MDWDNRSKYTVFFELFTTGRIYDNIKIAKSLLLIRRN